MIGYPSGAILPARDTGLVPQVYRSFLSAFFTYNESFIDQACSVKMAGYWPRSCFACLWTSTSSRSINTQKENLANIQPSDRASLVNNPYFRPTLSAQPAFVHFAASCFRKGTTGLCLHRLVCLVNYSEMKRIRCGFLGWHTGPSCSKLG